MTLAVSQSLGTVAVDIDCEKIICSTGAISAEQHLRIIGEIPSGPGDLLGSSSLSNLEIPSTEKEISGIVEYGGESMFGIFERSLLVNTEWNCLFRSSALSKLSVMGFPLDDKVDTPT